MEPIEVSILKGLMYNEEYFQASYPHLENKFFDGACKTVFSSFSSLVERYGERPSLDALVISIKKLPLNESDYNNVVDTLEEMFKGRNEKLNVDWLVDETESYCRDKSIYKALYDCLNIVEGRDKKLDRGSIPELLTDAINVNFKQKLGLDYFEDAEKRFEKYINPEERISLPLLALNYLTNGGLPKKTLNIFLASTNVGKSAIMCWLAGELLKQGLNVLYISAEMSEEAIQERVDANLLDVTTDELRDPNLDKKWFMGKIRALKERTTGRFIAKEYPTSSAHAGHVRHFLNECRQKANFIPDIIFLDYINIFASSRYRTLNGVNSYSYVKAIAEEFRGLAVEFEVPIVSATQINREGSKNMSPDLTDTSESFGLPATADWMAAIVTSEDLMEMNRQAIITLKTRYGNKKKVSKKQVVGVDFDKMRYYDVIDEDGQADDDINASKPDFPKKNKGSTSMVDGWDLG